MATSFVDLSELGDSSGEAFGDGLETGLGYSGAALDDIETPDVGSALTLAPAVGNDVSIFDSPTGYDSINLAGNSDAAPNPLDDVSPLTSLEDAQIGGTNGAGTADSSALHPTDISSLHDTFLLTSAVNKYGSVFGALFQKGAAPTAPTVSGSLPNANPNFRRSAPVSSNFVTVVLVIVAILLIMFVTGE